MPAIVHLIGYPGVGKLTVARALTASVPDDAPDRFVLVDNHLISNPILTVTPRGPGGRVPQQAWDLVAGMREQVLRAIVELSPPSWSFVFTNVVRSDVPDRPTTPERLQMLAAERDASYVPVVLHCDRVEQLRRVVGDDRAQRQKWTDVDAVAAFTASGVLAPPHHPHRLDIDVTDLAPAESARRILEHVRSR